MKSITTIFLLGALALVPKISHAAGPIADQMTILKSAMTSISRDLNSNTITDVTLANCIAMENAAFETTKLLPSKVTSLPEGSQKNRMIRQFRAAVGELLLLGFRLEQDLEMQKVADAIVTSKALLDLRNLSHEIFTD